MRDIDPRTLDPFCLTHADVRALTARGRRARALAVRAMLGRVFNPGRASGD